MVIKLRGMLSSFVPNGWKVTVPSRYRLPWVMEMFSYAVVAGPDQKLLANGTC